MERKFVLNLFYMGVISAVIAIVVTGVVFFQSFKNEMKDNLITDGTIIASAYADLDDVSELKNFASDTLRITLIQSDGTVLFESATDYETMGNHLNRPEIQQALQSGTGSATRMSETISMEEYYYAMKMQDGNILRVSITVSSIYSMFGREIPMMLFIFLLVSGISVVLSIILTRKILKPIQAIPSKLEDDTLAVEEEKIYPELKPFIKEIQTQRKRQEKLRQDFTANVSHELKTPMTSISGYAEMIATGMAQEKDIPYFAKKIQRECERMLTLISDIIQLSKLDNIKPEDMNEEIDLLGISETVKEALESTAEKKHIRMKITGQSETFHGCQREIYELIYNLVDNAIKYNREYGNIDITISEKCIAVADTGIGIAEKHQERIYERFYRVDKSRSREKGGTGLGLSIVKHIVEHHNAKITIDSMVNVGTTFTVKF